MSKKWLVVQVSLAGLLLLLVGVLQAAAAVPCDVRVNDNPRKLLECVAVEGVRAHQAALQAIADANGGIRTSGTPGYDASVDYVVDQMEAAGYRVTVQPFDYLAFIRLGPSTLEQTAPGAVTYVEGVDYALMDQTDAGDVTATVTPVDLQLFLGNNSTSGCEAGDFVGFPAGNIALMQRGTCTFQLKAENAAAAGAVGAIVFNQGNTEGRKALFVGTLTAAYTGGIPVFSAPYDRGVEWAGTAGLVLHMFADTFRGQATTYNVLAETTSGNPNNVVMAGAHLDSVDTGPGIQDNGSGSAALIEIARQLAKVKPRNMVRFAWWGAEEAGLVGSTFYVNSLSPDELPRIALYLNFDMIGSPNFVRFVYDGDNSDTAGTNPPGSGVLEQLFLDYFNARGLPIEPTEIGSRSDHAAFRDAGIPIGGLFTGAEGIKTPAQVAVYGGTAGIQYDPCYHQACDTFDNISLVALDQNSDAAAFAILSWGMNTQALNGVKGKGNFKREPGDQLGPLFVR